MELKDSLTLMFTFGFFIIALLTYIKSNNRND
ncbi:MAG: putative holin-like toxin [Bacilli bacterium]